MNNAYNKVSIFFLLQQKKTGFHPKSQMLYNRHLQRLLPPAMLSVAEFAEHDLYRIYCHVSFLKAGDATYSSHANRLIVILNRGFPKNKNKIKIEEELKAERNNLSLAILN